MPLSAREHLDREFLSIRAALLDIAASLDRIERGEGGFVSKADVRHSALMRAATILTDNQPDRARRIQTLLSDDYSSAWRDGRC